MKFKIGIILFLLVFLGALYAFMAGEEFRPKNAVTVFSASSFAYVLHEEEAAIEAATGLDLTIVEAASSTLARQIEEGAPADVFITADKVWLDYLRDAGHFEGIQVKIAGNSLSLVFTLETYNDFCNVQFFAPPTAPEVLTACPFEGKVSTGDPEFVPLGKYAKEALEFYEIVLDLVPTANASAALALFETGATGGAILYTTEIRDLDKNITAYPFPKESHQPILYFAAPLKQSNSTATENFLDFLNSEAFKTILKARGFEVEF